MLIQMTMKVLLVDDDEIVLDYLSLFVSAAGYDVRENDPFESPAPFALAPRDLSPYVIRTRFSWPQMRDAVVGSFPKAPGPPKDKAAYLKTVDEIYVEDEQAAFQRI